MMLYEKPLRRINSGIYGALIALVAAPVLLVVGLTKCLVAVERAGWWQWYWARVQWHEQEARKCATWQRGKRWGHYAMMWMLGAPVWGPLILLALWLLGRAME